VDIAKIPVPQGLLDLLVALLYRIELWTVGWKIDQFQAFAVSSQKSANQRAFVPRGIVHPNHNARILLQKSLEKTDELPLVQPRIECHPQLSSGTGNHQAEVLPCVADSSHGLASTNGPAPAQVRSYRDGAFVQKKDRESTFSVFSEGFPDVFLKWACLAMSVL